MFMIRRPYGYPSFYRDLDRAVSTTSEETPSWTPSVDIREEEDHYLLMADLPGVDRENIEVKVEDDTLLLSGNREALGEESGEGYAYSERRFGSFARRFNLGKGVYAAGIEASYKDGVLTVTIPKKEEVKPRQIPVSTN